MESSFTDHSDAEDGSRDPGLISAPTGFEPGIGGGGGGCGGGSKSIKASGSKTEFFRLSYVGPT